MAIDISNVIVIKGLRKAVELKYMSGYCKKTICEDLGTPRELVDQILYKSYGIKPRKQGENNDDNN